MFSSIYLDKKNKKVSVQKFTSTIIAQQKKKKCD